jgi:RNA polymerase sigma-70 factor (ECF subfamily)
MHGSEPPTAELVVRAQAGDAQAFTALYDRHARAVATVVAERLRAADDRADAVQETFVRAWTKLDTLRDPAQFLPWVYAIARNAATSIGRQHARRSETELTDDAVPADNAATADELAETAELLEAVSAAGALLSHRDATVLSMAVNLGFGPAEIAFALGVTENNASVILHRARQRLRNALAAGHRGPAADVR